MTKIFTAAVLCLSVNSASAMGFAPWEGRGHDSLDATQSTVTIESFYRHGLPTIRDTQDQEQREFVIVPWYLQSPSV